MNFASASAFIAALGATGSTVDFRACHDQRKDIPAIPFRGTLEECWSSICHYNDQGYGIFAVVNALDGNGRELSNVAHIRAHFIDLDNLSAQQNYERAAQWLPSPGFAVSSSAGKYHVYWPVVPYVGNDAFTLIQRKLRQFFDGDKTIIDATRIMRLPGTFHRKGDSRLVECWSLPGYGVPTTGQALLDALVSVNVIDGVGGRHPLGDPKLAAPSLDWITYALSQVDPNSLDRGEWISFTASIKQAAWSHGTPDQIFDLWSKWCAQYAENDPGENLKQWNNLRETEVGWPSIQRRIPAIMALQRFKPPVTGDNPSPVPNPQPGTDAPPMPVPAPPMTDCSGEFLDANEQKTWFQGCVYIERMGEILTPSGRMMNASKFNGAFGGKLFIITADAKVTDEPWKAATRSTIGTVKKVDHLRFVPMHPQGHIIEDELGRKGVNTYKPATIRAKEGNIDIFHWHMSKLLPVENDRKQYLDYLAHNIKYPGHKIPWAPLLQSAEGAGKGVIKRVMRHCMGGPYVHVPNAQELVESGSKFNAWMRAKLFIIVDEIKVDERRDMIEVLKPMISEAEIEIQGKGHDQDKEDNYSNWAFFSNYKDAIPVNKNGRRFSINYSAMQSHADLEAAGMNEDYFNKLYAWLDFGGGVENIAHWFLNYPIERGAVPMRAPVTSSTREAMQQSRGPIEIAILDAIEDGLCGFRGGWISVLAVMSRLNALGIKQPATKTVTTILEALGYYSMGRAPRAFFQEKATERGLLYAASKSADVNEFGRLQGYE